MRIFAIVLALCSVLFSCTGGQGVSPDGYITPDPAKGVNIHPTAWMYTAIDGGYLGTLERGEVVGISENTGKNQKGWEYTQVKRPNGQDVWVFSSHIIPGTRPGIILKEGIIYTQALASKKSTNNEKVDAYTIVAATKLPKTPEYIQVSYFKKDKNLTQRNKVFVKSDIVSFFDSDIQAMILYDLALADKDPDGKKELLNSALQLESPAFKQMIAAELSTLEGGAEIIASGDATDTVEVERIYLTIQDDVQCFSDPTTDSENKGSFKINEKLMIDKRTKDLVELGGDSSYWYHVKDKDGWVFGAYITEAGD